MLATKRLHVPCPATARRTGRRLLLLGLLAAPIARAHAAGIRIIQFDLSASARPEQLRKILVLGWGTRQDLRRLFEDAVAQEMRGFGVEAASSHTRLTADEAQLRAAVTRLVKAESYDGVLVARLIAKEATAAARSPAQEQRFAPSLESDLAQLETPSAQTQEGLVAVTETSLYRVADGARVWSALTDVEDPKDPIQTTRDYASVVVAALRSHKLL